jgi:uncharacterized protein (TIGR02147 family)
MPRIDIHDYMEYRAFLRDALRIEKEEGRITGQRDVASFLGLKSSGHVSWILQGKRDLMPRLVARVATLLRLSSQEAEYLALMVEHNDTSSPEDRRRLTSRIAQVQSLQKRKLSSGKLSYLSSWRNAVVRELVAIETCTLRDAARMGAELVPEATADEVLDSLQILQELDLVRTDEQGTLRRTDTILSADKDTSIEAVRGFQEGVLDLARFALHNTPPAEREISTITFSASPERFAKIRTRLKEMRQEILALIRTDPEPTRVYQLAIQAFPVTKPSRLTDA